MNESQGEGKLGIVWLEKNLFTGYLPQHFWVWREYG